MALTDKLTAIGDAVRAKTGSTEKLSLTDMVTEIGKLWKASNPTATSSDVISGKSFVDSSGTLANGSMKNLTTSSTVTLSSSNATPVLLADNAFMSTNSDGTARLALRYAGGGGYLQNNTLVGLDRATVASKIGLTADKIVQGNTILGVAGTASSGVDTSSATATAGDVLSGKTFYAGDKELKTGTLTGYGIAAHVRRNSGGTSTTTSNTYHLPAGTYTYNYLSTIYTYPSSYGCNFQIYVDGVQKVSYSTLSRYSEFLGNLYIFWGSTSGTLTLSKDADVYIKMSLTLDSAYPNLSQGSVYLQRN